MPLVIIGMYMLTKNMLLNFILSLLLLIPSYNQSLKKIKIIKIKIKKHLKDMIHQIYFYRTTFIGTTFNYVLCMVALGSVVFWALSMLLFFAWVNKFHICFLAVKGWSLLSSMDQWNFEGVSLKMEWCNNIQLMHV